MGLCLLLYRYIFRSLQRNQDSDVSEETQFLQLFRAQIFIYLIIVKSLLILLGEKIFNLSLVTAVTWEWREKIIKFYRSFLSTTSDEIQKEPKREMVNFPLKWMSITFSRTCIPCLLSQLHWLQELFADKLLGLNHFICLFISLSGFWLIREVYILVLEEKTFIFECVKQSERF